MLSPSFRSSIRSAPFASRATCSRGSRAAPANQLFVLTLISAFWILAGKPARPSNWIEARTWRWRGHWAGDEQRYRTAPPAADVEDPLDLYAYRLLEHGLATQADLIAVHCEVETEVKAAMDRAATSPDAGETELGLEDVYA